MKQITPWVLPLFFSILLNLCLFGIMPSLLKSSGEKMESPLPLPRERVNVVRIKKPDTPPARKKIKPPEEQKLRKTKQNTVQQKTLRQRHPMPSNLPELPFEVNSKLPTGPMTIPVLPMATAPLGAPKPTIYQAFEIDAPLIPLAQRPPLYPYNAKRRGIEGRVKVRFIVNQEGLVEQVEILEANPKQIFDRSVTRCVSAWRFSPGTAAGEPVKTLVQTTVRFKLDQ